MWKDIVFCLIIIIVIIAVDFFIQNYITSSTVEMSIELNELKQEVFGQKEDGLNNINTDEIKKIWKERYKILASVIEHDELEKVEKNLTGINSALQSKEVSDAISEIDESIFTLSHIKDKYSFKIENIF